MPLMIAALMVLTSSTAMAAPKETQIQVKLFEQPCLLVGPFDEETLRQIHSISPERIPLPETLEQSRQSLLAARKVTGTPAGLDRYREKLIRRLEAQQAYFEAFGSIKKEKKATALFEKVKTFQSPEKMKRFRSAFGKLAQEKNWNVSAGDDAALTLFNDSVEPFPEEEFHRAIQKQGIRYACSFEGEGAGESEESSEG